jgi:hypothetical protein
VDHSLLFSPFSGESCCRCCRCCRRLSSLSIRDRGSPAAGEPLCLGLVSSSPRLCVWPQQRGHQPTPPIWQPHISGLHHHAHHKVTTGRGQLIIILGLGRERDCRWSYSTLRQPPLSHHYSLFTTTILNLTLLLLFLLLLLSSINNLSLLLLSSFLSSPAPLLLTPIFTISPTSPHLTSPSPSRPAPDSDLFGSSVSLSRNAAGERASPLPSFTVLSASALLYLSMFPPPLSLCDSTRNHDQSASHDRSLLPGTSSYHIISPFHHQLGWPLLLPLPDAALFFLSNCFALHLQPRSATVLVLSSRVQS